MRFAILGIGLAAAACQHGTRTPAATAPESVQPTQAMPAAVTLPRYFPRTPARVTVVGTIEGGLVATHGSMRLLLRDDEALPDSAPSLVATSAAGSESGGTPTSTPVASTVAVPERLGGGWLFVVGRELWHAPGWLERPRRLFEFVGTPRVHLGLDALVAQESGRAAFAFDVTGKTLPLTHWPESPAIADLATRDAKHAAVVADLRGLSVTEDGGVTWREIPSARTPFGIRAAAGGYVVRGRNGGDERETTWRIDVHGELVDGHAAPAFGSTRAIATGAWERVITQGYDDVPRGRFVVLDHGALEIYRKTDGALLERTTIGDAQDGCRPIHWPSAVPGASPGFACLGPHGTTLWRVGDRSATEVARLAGGRRVWSSEVGALAVEGACENATLTAGTTTLCVWGRRSDRPTTVRLQGSTADDVILPLRDGGVVVLRPPSGPRHARRAAEMFVDGTASGAGTQGRVHGVPLQPGALKADVAEMLAEGHWRADVEALDHGDLALWIEHDARLLGVRIHADGRLDVGPRSAVAVVHRTAGLRSLSWSPGGASFESIDGGMHYTQIGLPAADPAPAFVDRPAPQRSASPTRPPPTPTDAGCTAIGCILPTLVRVGWGADAARATEPERPQPAPTSTPRAARLVLSCGLVSRSSDEAKPTIVRPTRGQPTLSVTHLPYPMGGGGGLGALPFFGTKPPVAHGDQVLLGWDTVDPADKRSSTFAGRVYLWGSFALGPDPQAGWQWRWFDARARSVRATAIARPPETLAAGYPLQGGMMARPAWSIVASSDPRRAVGLHGDNARTSVFSLVDGEAPTPIELEDGSPFGVLDAALAAPGDRTILSGAVGDPAGTAVYVAQGARAERVALVPRVGVQGKPTAAVVGLHTDGVRIAIAVEDHDVAARLDSAFYLREAYPAEGPIRRYSAAGALHACATDGAGFEAWTKLELGSDVAVQGRTVHLQGPIRARVRFGDDGSLCVAEVTSDIDGEGATLLSTAAPRAGSGVPLTIGHGNRHYTLACGEAAGK